MYPLNFLGIDADIKGKYCRFETIPLIVQQILLLRVCPIENGTSFATVTHGNTSYCRKEANRDYLIVRTHPGRTKSEYRRQRMEIWGNLDCDWSRAC